MELPGRKTGNYRRFMEATEDDMQEGVTEGKAEDRER